MMTMILINEVSNARQGYIGIFEDRHQIAIA